MAVQPTKMWREILEIPEALQRLHDQSEPAIAEIAAELRCLAPRLICTVARGSSDHAATYLQYAIQILARIPVTSIGPSVHSIYGVTLDLNESVCLAISQSGQSPDIVQTAGSAKAGGALLLALANDRGSPLAAASDHLIDVRAGQEKSIAATKTFVNTIAAGLLLLAHWREDQALLNSLRRLPALASKTIDLSWDTLTESLMNLETLFVLGRGPSNAIANEVALKFKEVCRIQGEAFSAAEVMHGPISVMSPQYLILALIARDRSEDSITRLADDLAKRGAKVLATSDKVRHAHRLPFIPTNHPLTDPLMLVVSFYAAVEKLARRRGFDPDQPRHLKKVTKTT